jgi:hypothetical protein
MHLVSARTWVDGSIRLNHIRNGSSDGTFHFATRSTNNTRCQGVIQSKRIANRQSHLSDFQPRRRSNRDWVEYLPGCLDLEDCHVLAWIHSDNRSFVDASFVPRRKRVVVIRSHGGSRPRKDVHGGFFQRCLLGRRLKQAPNRFAFFFRGNDRHLCNFGVTNDVIICNCYWDAAKKEMSVDAASTHCPHYEIKKEMGTYQCDLPCPRQSQIRNLKELPLCLEKRHLASQ